MTILKLTPDIFPFISKDKKYVKFASLGRFSKMETILLMDSMGKNAVMELNSDDFILSRGFRGTDDETSSEYKYDLYYETEYPVSIGFIYLSKFTKKKKNEHKD